MRELFEEGIVRNEFGLFVGVGVGEAGDALLCLVDAGGINVDCQGGRSTWVAKEVEACAEGQDMALPSILIDPKEY